MYGHAIVAALVAIALPSPSAAQDVSQAQALPSVAADVTPVRDAAQVAPEACQLHVWSTAKMKSYVTGWGEAMGGGLLAAALDGKRADAKTVEQMLRQALEGRPQAALLARLDLARMLKMPGAVIVPNPEATDPRKWKAAKGRLIGGTAPCYVEIIVRDMYFLKTALFPPGVRVNFTLRDFRGGRTTPLVTSGRGGIKLPVYPGVTTIDEAVITRTFEDAYVGAFEEFLVEQKLAPAR